MRKLEKFFDWYGQYVARKPFFFILVPALLTIVSTYGFLSFSTQDDIWDIYAPTNGLSRVEEAGIRRFEYASGSHHHRMQILVSKKNRGNILTNEALDEVSQAHKFVADNITVWDGQNQIAYKNLCGIYCNDSNAAVLAFLQATLNDTSRSSFKLTFPNAEALQKKIFIGYSIGDLKFEKGYVTEAKMIILHYMVDTSLPNGRQLAADFETKVRNFFSSITDISHHIKYSVLSRTRELEEQRAITITSLPFLGLTIIVLTAFMLLTLVRFPLYTSQHWQSIVGVLSPGMALWTTTGLLWGLGYPFSNILTVVPFLVVTIGIDDAFLILAGWRQSTKGESLEVRLGQSVAISGASVTVTSVTDVACFATGLFSNMPVVQLFCLYTTVALAIDFIYQMTFFTALVGVFVRKQVDIEKELIKTETKIEKTKDDESSSSSSLASLLTFVPTISQEAHTRNILEVFIDFLHTWMAKFIVLVAFFAHIMICLALVSKVNTNFDMENLYLEDSPLTDISRRMQNFVLGEAFVVNFGVFPMPDFDNAEMREKFEEMVKKLETMPGYGAGKENTNLWTREYSNAVAFWGETEDFWHKEDMVSNYREYGMDEKYITMKNDTNGDEIIDGFFFTITYQNFSNFLEVESFLEDRRAILKNYSSYFTISSHHPFEKVPTESAASAPFNFISTSVSAVVLMSLLVLVFVMNFEAIISVVISIVSICLGIVVYLHLWNVNLDAVSLISMLMSIGFSVDYSAHVCYHYFAHVHEDEQLWRSHNYAETRDRLLSTFRGVAWPVMQSGLSTILGMFPLMFVRAYVVAVFWKTVILVGILGMLHALVLLPVIFILTHDVKLLFRRKRTVNPSPHSMELAS
ncbi:hypothetical protein GCK72_005591 [Caenorhabditis remanei]|uniref:SSD domain-containing protein n=1 Tax=Caenorhabditis remanei TaxID=31234 RepID=A0A6A5HD01_CAERE|nr:hypothetical protein GCK72_005591 [Caenorhabditis remanei]KAF1765638.1 hypothetical protein GCK72_005591 [Caenorhabditis remanei]